MRERWNTLRSGALTLLCSLALLVVCGGLMPMDVQAEEPITVYFGENDQLPYYDEENPIYSLDLGEGTATLDPDSGTLTLDNITLEAEDAAGIWSWDGGDLTIVLKGSNTITVESEYTASGISWYGNLTIRGDGSLNIDATTNGAGISARTLTIENHANVTIEGAGVGQYAQPVGIYAENLVIADSNVEINDYYGIYATGDDTAISITDSTVTVTATAATPDDEDRYSGAIKACVDIVVNSLEDSYRAKDVTISGNSTVIADGGFFANLQIVPPTNGVTRVAVSAQPDGNVAEISGEGYPFSTTQNFVSSDELLKNGYLKIWAETPNNEGTGSASATKEPGAPCNHTYAWETYKAATATSDGVMRYRCTQCGDVEYEVPTAAYYVFNKNAQESIQKAAQGATVTVSTPIFISFHEMVKDALVARPDVTLVVDYKNQGKSYEMTIPAGSGDTLTTLFGDSKFAGFLYLGGAFATVEK